MTRLTPSSITLRSLLVPAIVVALGLPAAAQTPIERHSNNYTPQQDVQLGKEAAAEVRRQMPLLRDEQTEDFVERIGERLVDVIPQEWQQPEFDYTFDVVNLREINAFALPGGPMFLHRGMIEAARNEGEVAGVMAHELAHVVLRHGTVQATKGQKFQLGAMAGQVLGSIIGGRTGAIVAQGSELTLGGVFMKYGREYEREADIFGAQLMARAGYDPRHMATMFQTIEKQGGNRGPEWLSSHPNPGNRVQAINREAEMLQVASRGGAGGGLPAIHARLREMPQAPTTEQVARQQQGRTAPRGTTPTSARGVRVEAPSAEWRTHQPGDFLRVSVPENWRSIDGGGSTVTYAPEGGYVRAENGQSAFTHGVEIGVARTDGGNLQQQTEALVQSFARSNPQLRRQGGYSRTSIDGRRGLTTTLTNVSEVTGERETVNLSTTQLPDGNLFFMIGVAPASEARAYMNTFSRVRESVRIADRTP